MALALGTNCGFVSSAPVDDPSGAAVTTIDGASLVVKDTSPATAIKITEIGWWCNTASEEANFEVGLYAADGVDLPGEAGTRLYVDNTNAKGTDSGWKRVTVNWTISSSTAYWLGMQLDAVATATTTDRGGTGSGRDVKTGETALLDPYGGGGTLAEPTGQMSIYAVWEAAATGPANLKSYNTNLKANIKTINTNAIANVKTLNTNA